MVMAARPDVRTAARPSAAVDTVGLAQQLVNSLVRVPFRSPWRYRRRAAQPRPECHPRGGPDLHGVLLHPPDRGVPLDRARARRTRQARAPAGGGAREGTQHYDEASGFPASGTARRTPSRSAASSIRTAAATSGPARTCTPSSPPAWQRSPAAMSSSWTTGSPPSSRSLPVSTTWLRWCPNCCTGGHEPHRLLHRRRFRWRRARLLAGAPPPDAPPAATRRCAAVLSRDRPAPRPALDLGERRQGHPSLEHPDSGLPARGRRCRRCESPRSTRTCGTGRRCT